MSKFRTLAASSALMATLALPIFAVPAIAQTPEPQGAITALVDGTKKLGSGSGETVTDISNAYVGNAVVSSEGDAIGTVGSAATKENGGTAIVVTMDPALGSKVSGFELTLAAGQTADGTVELPWTKAELLGQLDNLNQKPGSNPG